ncbi:MAG: helix-turn-helix domain-containing protein [Mojavia pulchra JT2-VF2]|uniref:Helix-turn-helix domain-containing protein n=1 Tax=Mojavia pulchra JT2-VF2 TaxID=287848 RepID=A0A951UG25_9NOST|nr:helix-turn-helix domain-containing protein [Mojavia pulchra JT2-VF2]
MNIEIFVQRTEALHKHLADLYRTITILPWMPPELLSQAFKELHSTSGTLQLAVEELFQQNEQLIQTQNFLEAERERYQDLFEFAPDGYLVTNAESVIQEANYTAARLLNVSKNFLVGKPLVNFVPLEDRQHIRSEINQLSQSDRGTELLVPLQPHHGESFDAALTVRVVRNQQGKVVSLYWLLRNISMSQRWQSGLVKNDNDIIWNRRVYQYCKGDNIPLKPLEILYVCQGWVKLTTFCGTGEEILVGLARAGMVFGSSMTSLNIYQVTALSDVHLVSISVSEMAASPTLSQTLLPKVNQRLQQTESFLAISGRRQLQERLLHLLEFLKQEFGETVSEGTRLSIRLTHQDIASACCANRVTITRLITKLKQQGIISFDSKQHIILKNSY